MSKKCYRLGLLFVVLAFLSPLLLAQNPQPALVSTPHVIVLGVNGAEWDILKPLLVRGEMPNLAHVIQHGVSGKLRTVSAPNCPKVYSIFATSAPSEENGITGFLVAGVVATSSMLKLPPFGPSSQIAE